MKKISVIVPVYNCEKYLTDCFKSIKKQSFNSEDFEVIIINDGSHDNSIDIIKKYCKENENWKYIDQPNQGLSMARNNGLKLVDSEYITFLDSDDTLPVDALTNLYNSIIENDADMVIGGLVNYNSKGFYKNYTTKYLINRKEINYKNYKNVLNFVHAQGKLYKFSKVKNIKFLKGLKHEDNYYTGNVYLGDFKINMIDSIVYNHRVREGNYKSITQSLNYESFKDYLENIDYLIDENDYNYIFSRIYIHKIYNYIIRFVDYKDVKNAKKDAKELINKMINECNCNSFKKFMLKTMRSLLSCIVIIIKMIK